MKARSFFLIAFLFIAIMLLYFFLHPSYEKSLEAKFYYETSNYKEAYRVAKEAFELDRYNKMAATIMTQSRYSLRYVNYINDAKKYIKQIQLLIKDGKIDEAKRAKIRTIADIMVKAYNKLAPSVVVDKELIKEAKEYHEKFKQLYQKAH
ncbi:hypothetical protein MNB_SM-7-1260 [hydrothermal vent metagenome]|uniref:Uncharacterized protein n=1 Tax=hydrothermal vent metagenome TaxID=652676 RepID=A0A1W1BFZ5_9ZZZZ